jgi:transketolase
MSFASAVNRKAIDLGKLSVEMTTAAGSGHPSSALSLAHLVTALMYHQMRWDPKDPWNPAADRLVLSEGHAVPIVYAAYADLGGMIGRTREEARAMTRADAMTLRAIESVVDGHPHPQVGFPFFDAATGSLGQGLSVAAGLAASARMDGIDRNVYCIIGDGESREGQIWEAVDFVVEHALTNCVAIFNCNALAQSDWVSVQQSAEVLAKKLEAFGCVVRVIDGHDPAEIRKAFDELPVIKNGNRPLAIVAQTVKGWGSAAEQGMGKHGTPVKKDKMDQIFKELDQTARDLGLGEGSSNGELKLPPPPKAPPREHKPIKIPSFDEQMEKMGFLKDVKAGKPFAPRKAYGVALVALGEADKRVVGLDADVKNSTHAEWFAKKFPKQFLECRIAEQNMFSVAAGVSAAGKVPFCSTFAKFVTRGYDQIEMAIIGGANIKITGTHAGVTLAADGPSQMSLSDVAFFRSFTHTKNFNGQPAVRYFFPSDAVSCYQITGMMANIDGTCYQRALRAETKVLYKHDEQFPEGGFKVLREGRDACFVAAGYMVHECLRVADEMAKSGRKATVIDAYALPIADPEQILAIAARSGGTIVTVEDNYTGGLDAELAIAIARSGDDVKLKNIFVDRIPKSGREPDDVLNYLDLGAKAILQAVS